MTKIKEITNEYRVERNPEISKWILIGKGMTEAEAKQEIDNVLKGNKLSSKANCLFSSHLEDFRKEEEDRLKNCRHLEGFDEQGRCWNCDKKKEGKKS